MNREARSWKSYGKLIIKGHCRPQRDIADPKFARSLTRAGVAVVCSRPVKYLNSLMESVESHRRNWNQSTSVNLVVSAFGYDTNHIISYFRAATYEAYYLLSMQDWIIFRLYSIAISSSRTSTVSVHRIYLCSIFCNQFQCLDLFLCCHNVV